MVDLVESIMSLLTLTQIFKQMCTSSAKLADFLELQPFVSLANTCRFPSRHLAAASADYSLLFPICTMSSQGFLSHDVQEAQPSNVMQADEKRVAVSTFPYMRNGTKKVSMEDARGSRENEVHKSYRAYHHGKEWSCAVDVVPHRESIAEFF